MWKKFFLCFLLWVTVGNGMNCSATEKPHQRALQIAQSQPRLQQLMAKLRQEVKSVSDPSLPAEMKKDALMILDHPVFTFIEAHRNAESEIIQKLVREGFLKSAGDASAIF